MTPSPVGEANLPPIGVENALAIANRTSCGFLSETEFK